MNFPENLKFSKEHEWVMVEGDVALIGITEFAQSELGDVVYVELPEVGEKITKDDPFGSVESVKAVSDLFAPVSGAVIEVNDSLPDNPELVNEDSYGDGWMIKVQMSDKEELKDLLAADEYGEFVERKKAEDDDEDDEEEEEEEKEGE
jgi:glycine cleavage system H protein